MPVNSPITVTISTANEKQYLKFQPTSTGFYTIESFNNSGDPNILFYNSDYTQIGYSYDDGDNYNFDFTYHHYIGISGAAIGNRIELYSSISDRTRWKIYAKSSGELFFVPKSAPGMVITAADSNEKSELILKWLSDSLNGQNIWKLEVQSPVEPEGQWMKNWCWVAASRTYINHYNLTHLSNMRSIPTQAETVTEIKGEAIDYSGLPADIMTALSFYQKNFLDNELLELVYHQKIYDDATLRQFLNDGHTVLIGRYTYYDNAPTSAHAYVIAGYSAEFVNGNIQYNYIILNPWPEDVPNPWEEQQYTIGQLHIWSHQQLCNGVQYPTNDEQTEKIWTWSIVDKTTYWENAFDPVL